MPAPPKPISSHCLDYLQKVWPAEFSEDRNPLEEKSHLEYVLHASSTTINPSSHEETPLEDEIQPKQPDVNPSEHISQDGSNRLKLFLQSYDDDNPSIEVEGIMDFCREVRPEILRFPGNVQRRAAWLDDRLYSFYCGSAQAHSPARNSKVLTLEAQQQSSAHGIRSLGASPNDISSEHRIGDNTAKSSSASLPYREYELPLSPSALFQQLDQKV
jgi:hypothetical protein